MGSYVSTRRDFLKQTAGGAVGLSLAGFPGRAEAADVSGVSIVVGTGDTIASAPPSQWAVSQLQAALGSVGISVQLASAVSQATAGNVVLVVAGATSVLAGQILAVAGVAVPAAAESLVLAHGSADGRAVLLAAGRDARGLGYAVLELTDRVLLSTSAAGALTVNPAVVEQPSVRIRSISRLFQSELEDKPWFNDRTFWTGYLGMLAADRINRFSLCLGMGYDWGMVGGGVGDPYFFFAYPFFVSIGGVSVTTLSTVERAANLTMLRFISDECAKRGIDFQLALWTHGYNYPSTTYAVRGLPGNGSAGHAQYCRDALSAIVTACPGITGVTFRVHNESGIDTGSYPFWQTVFSALTPFAQAGRPIEIDLHGKECYQQHVDAALATGNPAVISPKKVGEHQGIPCHQMSLRHSERSNSPDRTVINGQASRAGYSNFLKENRTHGVLHRIWPGSQRVLLTGDPVFAAGYGKSSSFCDSAGVEWCEPLSGKGRRNTGTTGNRCGYSDLSLNPTYDYQKYLYSYRVWGRLLYNPDADPEVWRRYLRAQFGAAAQPAVESALGNASRIILLLTTCHGAGVSWHDYWPEMDTNFPIMDGQPSKSDTNSPLRSATSFDPQLFLDIDAYADALLNGTVFAQDKYLPIEFAQWMEDLANTAATALATAASQVTNPNDPVFRRLSIDVTIQSGLGLFYGRKWRSAVLWSIHRKTNDATAKADAIALYNSAKQAWTSLAATASVYRNDITYGPDNQQRGHWSDRLAAFTNDINAMTAAGAFTTVNYNTTAAAISTVKGTPARPVPGCTHIPPASFSAGQSIAIVLTADAATTGVKLYYRHVNQAVDWQVLTMTPSNGAYSGTIPTAYTQTVFPIQYYFALTKGSSGVLYPGLDATLSNQPYHVLRLGAAGTAVTGLTAAGGDGQIILRWTAFVGASTYHVKRAASTGGPYTTIASPASNTFTDAGLTNGTPYYYVVTAVTLAGETNNSGEVSATPSQVSVFEPFNYATGNLHGANGGTGWAGPWAIGVNSSLVSVTTVDTTLSPPALSYAPAGGAPVPGGGTAADMVATGTTSSQRNIFATRQFSPPLSQTFFVGYLLHIKAGSSFGTTAGEAFLSYFSETSQGTENNPDGANFGPLNANNWQNREGGGGGVAVSKPGTTVAGAVNYVVARYTHNGTKFVSCDLWVNPSVASLGTPDSTWTLASTFNVFNWLYFRGVTTRTDAFRVDQFRIASRWDDIVPKLPGAPTGFNATADDLLVTLSWNAVPGATGYQVKRSASSGGPYTVIAANVAQTSFVDSSLINNQSYFYTVSGKNAIVEGPDTLEIAAVPHQTFQSWQQQSFTVEQLALAAISGPHADANGDGTSNLHAYAFGLSPWVQIAGNQTVVGSENGYLTITFTRRTDPTDVTYAVEVSDDLVTWNSGPSYTALLRSTPINAATERIVVRDKSLMAVAPQQKRFMRLRVSEVLVL